MQSTLLIVGLLAAAGAAVSGVLGFLIHPAKTRRSKKRGPSQREGFARALFIIFAAAAFVALFLGLMMHE